MRERLIYMGSFWWSNLIETCFEEALSDSQLQYDITAFSMQWPYEIINSAATASFIVSHIPSLWAWGKFFCGNCVNNLLFFSSLVGGSSRILCIYLTTIFLLGLARALANTITGRFSPIIHNRGNPAWLYLEVWEPHHKNKLRLK